MRWSINQPYFSRSHNYSRSRIQYLTYPYKGEELESVDCLLLWVGTVPVPGVMMPVPSPTRLAPS
jgi:hypothetical protein